MADPSVRPFTFVNVEELPEQDSQPAVEPQESSVVLEPQDLALALEPEGPSNIAVGQIPYMLVTYTDPSDDRTTTWQLPWHTDVSLELVDDLGNIYNAATTSGHLTYLSRETTLGRIVLYDAQAQESVETSEVLDASKSETNSSASLHLHLTDDSDDTFTSIGSPAATSTPTPPCHSKSDVQTSTNSAATATPSPPTCKSCRRSFTSESQLKSHSASCTWCNSCKRWADEIHVMGCEYAKPNAAKTARTRPNQSRLYCKICGKFTSRNYMGAHMTRLHSLEAGTWRRNEHPEVLSEDEATIEDRLSSENIRLKLSIWSSSGKIYSDEDHRKMAKLLISQASASLSLKEVSQEQRANTEAAIIEVEKALSDCHPSLETVLELCSNLNRHIGSL